MMWNFFFFFILETYHKYLIDYFIKRKKKKKRGIKKKNRAFKGTDGKNIFLGLKDKKAFWASFLYIM